MPFRNTIAASLAMVGGILLGKDRVILGKTFIYFGACAGAIGLGLNTLLIFLDDISLELIISTLGLAGIGLVLAIITKVIAE